MQIKITLTLAGLDTGPFDLYEVINGTPSLIQSGVAKEDLLAGVTVTVDDNASSVKVLSTGVCTNEVTIPITDPGITTTTTTTIAPTTTTTTTTEALGTCYNLNIPVAVFSNNGDDLYITMQPYQGELGSVLYSSLPDGGSYTPDYEINICSMVEPTFRYGPLGPHITIESLIVTPGGSCTTDGDCTPTTTTTTTTVAPTTTTTTTT